MAISPCSFCTLWGCFGFDLTALFALSLFTAHDFITVKELDDIFGTVNVGDIKCFPINAPSSLLHSRTFVISITLISIVSSTDVSVFLESFALPQPVSVTDDSAHTRQAQKTQVPDFLNFSLFIVVGRMPAHISSFLISGSTGLCMDYGEFCTFSKDISPYSYELCGCGCSGFLGTSIKTKSAIGEKQNVFFFFSFLRGIAFIIPTLKGLSCQIDFSVFSVYEITREFLRHFRHVQSSLLF